MFLGPVNSTFAIGIVTFTMTGNVSTDGIDVTSGFFNGPFDSVLDNCSLRRPPARCFNAAGIKAESGN